VLAAGILGLSVSPAASAACERNEPGYLWNFDGAIAEKYPVRMTLVFSGDTLEGVYTYRSQLRDIRLRGRIDGGKSVVLDELDAAGRITARFEGEFVTRDPKGRYGDSELACEVIVGSWGKVGSSERLSAPRARPRVASSTATAPSACATTRSCTAAQRVSGAP
jgi:hypothetical protein